MTKSKHIRIPGTEQVLLARRTALYLRSGIPLLPALELVIASARHKGTVRLLTECIKDVRRGLPLSHTLSRYPTAFPSMAMHVISFGEQGGNLPGCLDHIASHIGIRTGLKRKVFASLAYPALILLGTFAVSGVLVFVAFPKVVPLFRGMHTTLPFPTRMLIFLSAHAIQCLVVFTTLTVGLLVAIAAANRLPGLARSRDHMLLHMPLLGQSVRDYAIASMFRGIAMLQVSGMRIDETLVRTRESCGNAAYRESLAHIEEVVRAGGKLSSGMRAYPRHYPLEAMGLIEAGELTGTLSASAQAIAQMYEERLDERLRMLSSLLEPILMLVMGGVVGFVALAIIAPMYSLTQNLSNY